MNPNFKHIKLLALDVDGVMTDGGMYYYAIKQGLLKDVEDFYENKHLNSDLLSVNFTDLLDDEIHNLLYEANKTLLENYHRHLFENQIGALKQLYFEKSVGFRGFR